MTKRKSVKRKKATTKKRKSRVSEDTLQRRKHARGGRIEAYTFGETLGGKGWP